MISNGKTLKYKVLDTVESYNFHIWFISVRAQNSYHFEKKEKKNVKKEKNPGRTQAAASTPGSSARRIPRAATAVRRGPPPAAGCTAGVASVLPTESTRSLSALRSLLRTGGIILSFIPTADA
jgi:hypothetical protein